MPRAGPRKVQRYSLEFKLKAVKLSQLKDVEVQAAGRSLMGSERRGSARPLAR
jgi:transposase-like protein